MQLDMFNMFRFQRIVWVSATSLGVSAKRNIIQIYLLIRVGKVQWRWAVEYAWSHHEKTPATVYMSNERNQSESQWVECLQGFGLRRIWRSRFTNCWLPTPQLLPHLLSTIHWGRWPGLCGGLCCWFGDGILHLVAAQLCCAGWTHVPGIFNGSWLGMSFWVRCGFVWTFI